MTLLRLGIDARIAAGRECVTPPGERQEVQSRALHALPAFGMRIVIRVGRTKGDSRMRWFDPRLAALLATVCLSSAPAAHAGVLDATKPSQVVHLRTFGTSCPDGGNAIDLLTKPDGTTVYPYALPAKQVLIVRRIDFVASPGVGTSAIVSLELGGNVVGVKTGVGNASFGAFDGSIEFQPALVVADVAKLCIKLQNGANVLATLSGFLAKNK
jgi:hypothetical protein